MKISRKKVKALVAVVIILIALRIALPHVLLYLANKKLANVNGYYGHIEDIDVAIYRGSFILHDAYLNAVNKKSKLQTPFIKTRKIDFSLEWRALWERRIVAKAIVDVPILIFTKDKVELAVIAQDSSDFRKLLRDLIPIDINTLNIRNGQLKYVDHTRKPNVDLAITDLDAVANNLRNVYKKTELLPATIKSTGSVYKSLLGNFKLPILLLLSIYFPKLSKLPNFVLYVQNLCLPYGKNLSMQKSSQLPTFLL